MSKDSKSALTGFRNSGAVPVILPVRKNQVFLRCSGIGYLLFLCKEFLTGFYPPPGYETVSRSRDRFSFYYTDKDSWLFSTLSFRGYITVKHVAKQFDGGGL